MDELIARFMLKASKFEYFLVNQDVRFAKLRTIHQRRRVEGIDWQRVAQMVEQRFPFREFDFAGYGVQLFKETAPQYLVKRGHGRLGWDSDDDPIDSWERLLGRSFAQLRNNIAHGNKAQLPAPFTHDRTQQFLEAGERLIEFLATEMFSRPAWETRITFR